MALCVENEIDYKLVYPILKKHNCSGLFFIPSSIFNKKILNVQILHQLLALDKFDEMYDFLISELRSINYSMDDIKLNNSLDNNNVALFKQLLQYILPFEIRTKILEKLMKKYNISNDVKNFYIDVEDLKEMKQNGMYFGIHTITHPNLKLLNYEEQFVEINENLKQLKNNKLIEDELLSISYPYGLYNKDTLKIIKQLNIKYGFKAHVTNKKSNFEIDRIDCNILKENNSE